MQLSKSNKFISFGHKKVESMRLESLHESGKIPALAPLSKTDLIYNLRFFQDCLGDGEDVRGQFHSSRVIAKDTLQLNFESKKNFSKQKKVKIQLQRSKSQHLDKTGEHSVQAKAEGQSRKSDEVHGKFVPEGMHIDNLMNYITENPGERPASQNRLDAGELEKINKIMMMHSRANRESKASKRRLKFTHPKPSIDINLEKGPVESPKSFECRDEGEEAKFNCPKESFKLISNEQMKEDIQSKAEMPTSSIRGSHSRLELDFSDIEGSADSLVNPLDGILDGSYSLGSAREEEGTGADPKSGGETASPKSSRKESESLSEDEELDLEDPNFKFVDYIEAKTKKLYTKREIKANISWSSTEYDIYDPQFTDDEAPAKTPKSAESDKFYLDNSEEQEDPVTPTMGGTLETLEQSQAEEGGDKSQNREMKKFKVVISADGNSEEWESRSFNDSLININDLSEQVDRSQSSSTVNGPREQGPRAAPVEVEAKAAEEGPLEATKHKLTKTQDFKDLLRMSDAGQGRKNKHFVSLKKIREKGKVGIEKKWGQFLTRKVQERMRRDSELSGKESPFSRMPFTNRSITSKKPLNASLNIPHLPRLPPAQRNNFSFHSRYKDDMRSVTSTNPNGRRSRSKNTSLVRTRKYRHKSRKSSHCLKAGLFCVTSNTDNIYSVQNRRVTVDSADSIKSRHFFGAEGHVPGFVTQSRNLNPIPSHVASALSRKLSKTVMPENPSLFSSTHQERKKPFAFGFQIRGQYQTRFEKVGRGNSSRAPSSTATWRVISKK